MACPRGSEAPHRACVKLSPKIAGSRGAKAPSERPTRSKKLTAQGGEAPLHHSLSTDVSVLSHLARLLDFQKQLEEKGSALQSH